MGQAEVVVGAEHHELAALDDDYGVLGFGYRLEVRVQAGGLGLACGSELPALLEQGDLSLDGIDRHVPSQSSGRVGTRRGSGGVGQGINVGSAAPRHKLKRPETPTAGGADLTSVGNQPYPLASPR